jgi:hypothetical protein
MSQVKPQRLLLGRLLLLLVPLGRLLPRQTAAAVGDPGSGQPAALQCVGLPSHQNSTRG